MTRSNSLDHRPFSFPTAITDSGTEATEGALKFARKYGKIIDPSGNKTEIVSFNEAFHGRSMGALSVTHQKKYQAPFEPLVPGCVEAEFNNIQSINDLITEKTCGVILEPIQGEGGIMPAKEEWLRAVRQRCDEVNAVLIFDEIQVSPRDFTCISSIIAKVYFHSVVLVERERCGHIPTSLVTVIQMSLLWPSP